MVFPLGLMLGTVLYQLTSIIKKKVFTEILYIIANIKNGPYSLQEKLLLQKCSCVPIFSQSNFVYYVNIKYEAFNWNCGKKRCAS